MTPTNLNRPSTPRTLGELRQLTEHLPDATPLGIEDMDADFPAPAVYVDTTDQPLLIFMEPCA